MYYEHWCAKVKLDFEGEGLLSYSNLSFVAAQLFCGPLAQFSALADFMGEIVPFRLCQDQPDQTCAHVRTACLSVSQGPACKWKNMEHHGTVFVSQIPLGLVLQSLHHLRSKVLGEATGIENNSRPARAPTCQIGGHIMIPQHHQYSTSKIAAGNIATHAVDLLNSSQQYNHVSGIQATCSAVGCLSGCHFLHFPALNENTHSKGFWTMSQKTVPNATHIRASILLGPTRTLCNWANWVNQLNLEDSSSHFKLLESLSKLHHQLLPWLSRHNMAQLHCEPIALLFKMAPNAVTHGELSSSKDESLDCRSCISSAAPGWSALSYASVLIVMEP